MTSMLRPLVRQAGLLYRNVEICDVSYKVQGALPARVLNSGATALEKYRQLTIKGLAMMTLRALRVFWKWRFRKEEPVTVS
jgi:hypothetical protein